MPDCADLLQSLSLAAGRETSADEQFLNVLALPAPLTQAVFALLPLPLRLRCREVSVPWRAFLDASGSLWRELNFSVPATGGPPRLSASLLLAACKQAAGHALVLNLTGVQGGKDETGACAVRRAASEVCGGCALRRAACGEAACCARPEALRRPTTTAH
jgi:hypothetical protein